MKAPPRGSAAARLEESAQVKLALARGHKAQFARAAAILKNAIRRGRKVMLFGNGGSAADAQHVAAEMVGRFSRERRAYPAIALTTDSSVLTSIANDMGYEKAFSRQIEALAGRGDVGIAISTSGSSANVLEGIRAARRAGAKVIGLTGARGIRMAGKCDAAFVVPSFSTPRIQEAHIAILHVLCEAVDEIA